DRSPHRRRQVQRSRVSGHKKPGPARESNELDKGRAKQTRSPRSRALEDFSEQRLLFGRAGDEDVPGKLRLEAPDKLGIIFGRPPLTDPASARIDHNELARADRGKLTLDVGVVLRAVRQREPPPGGLGRTGAQALGQRQALLHYVLRSARADSLGVKDSRSRLTQPVLREPHALPRAAESGKQRRLDESLKINGGVKRELAERQKRPRYLLESGGGGEFPAPAERVKLVHAADIRVPCEQAGVARLDGPVDLGLRERLRQGCYCRKRVHNVTDRAETDDQETLLRRCHTRT